MIYVSCVDPITVELNLESANHFEEMLEYYHVTYKSKKENLDDQRNYGSKRKMIYSGVKPVLIADMANNWRRFVLWLNESRIFFTVTVEEDKYNFI